MDAEPKSGADAAPNAATSEGPSSPSESSDPTIEALRRLLRFVYATNPFYAISALLMLVGLNELFVAPAGGVTYSASFDSWLLLLSLAGYTLLLAVTGLLLVRYGKVWDDARIILVTLVLLFVALSVSFDHLSLTGATTTMARLLSLGLAFAVLVSEGLRWGLGIRLGWLFRGPFYAMLALFFLYPILVRVLLDTVGLTDPKLGYQLTLWAIYLFPSAAGLIALTLLPAIWRGGAYVAENGTPWAWPAFPWSIFVLLAVAVAFRSYYLTLSFHPQPGMESIFGLYFLVPFLAVLCLLVFEMGRIAGKPGVRDGALLASLPLLFAVLVRPEPAPAFAEFIGMHVAQVGSPALVAWWLLLGLHGYGMLRRSAQGEAGFVVLLAAGSFIGPETLDLSSLRFPVAAPLFAATVVELAMAVRNPRSSWRWFLVLLVGLATLTVRFWETWFVGGGFVVPANLLLAGTLLLGLTFRDDFALVLRWLGAIGLAIAGLLAMLYSYLAAGGPLDWPADAYGIVIAFVAWACWRLRAEKQFLAAAVAASVEWLGMVGRHVVEALRTLENPRAVALILGAMAAFGAALLLSLLKAGVVQTLLRRLPLPRSRRAP